MASEMRRAAQALVASRRETFETAHALDSAQRRLERSLAELPAPRAVRYRGEWKSVAGRPVFEASFEPTARARRFLNAASVVLGLLVLASAWAIWAPGENPVMKFLVPLSTALAILAFPLVVAALASHREAEESRIARAIKRALRDEESYPPAERWDAGGP